MTSIDESTGNVACECNHLTNFAILVVSNVTRLSEC